MGLEGTLRHIAIPALVALWLAAPAPGAEEKEKPGALSPAELMKLAENSSQTYTIGGLDGLQGVSVDEFADLFWPSMGEMATNPRVTGSASNLSIVEYDLGEACRELLRQGDQLFAAKKYGEALPIYQRASQESPGCYIAYSHVGDCHYFQGNPAEALKWYDQAADLNPDDFRGPFFRASALIKLGRFAEARSAYARALALRPHRETTVKAVRAQARDLGLTLVDQPFMPRALARREGSEIRIYADPDQPHWLVYGLCKAVWIGEPAHREERTGNTEHVWSLTEERQCLASMLATYAVQREDGSAEPDEALERIRRIAEGGLLDGFVVYEIAYRLSGQVTLLLPEETFEDLLAYVDRYVLVGKTGELQSRPDAAQ